MWLDEKQINKILHLRLLDGPKSIKNYLINLVGDEFGVYSIKTQYLMGVFILSKQELERVRSFEAQNYIPFPALYTTKEGTPAAFRFDRSRNIYIKSNTIKNSIALSIGQDSTVILENHNQSISTQEIGDVNYEIGLGYLVSFGQEIDEFNVYEYLDELIAYSIKSWRQDEPK